MSAATRATAQPRRVRVLVALIVALLCFAAVIRVSGAARGLNAFDQLWVGARALVAGGDPYALVGPGRALPQKAPNFYPVSAMVAVLPLAALPLEIARAAFFALSAGILAFALTRTSFWPLGALASGSFALALLSQQWAPLLTATLLLPGLSWVYAVKPNVGAALFAARPTWRGFVAAAVGTLVLVGVGFALFPGWLGEWTAATREAPHVRALVTHPAGPLLLLALARWRRPEGRLIAAFAIVPHSTLFYEALPLLVLVPSTARELRMLVILNWIGMLLEVWLVYAPGYEWHRNVFDVGELMLALAYLPALLMVLRRPNVAPDDLPMPAWIERAAGRVGGGRAGTVLGGAWARLNAPLLAK